MPSFGDGHAHPLPGGLEAVGPQVRPCKSVDEIVDVVRRFAAEHPDDEWIVGASYESSMAPGGLFDARWLDAAVPDRPVVLRAWDYHTVWCNSVALELAGISADTPDPVLGEIPRREDGSPLGTLREWGAVDLVQTVVPERDPAVRVSALRTAAEYYLSHGVTWVQDAWVEPADVDTYLDAAQRGALDIRFNLGLYADPRYFNAQLEHNSSTRDAVSKRRPRRC
jgi:predicted amidohydrolase YtcJ